MSSLDCLLASLGPPPPELCLEWAWQIELAVSGRLDQPLHWSQLEVTETGELRLLSSATDSPGEFPGSSRADTLIEQLLLWGSASGGATELVQELAPASNPADRHAQLAERTLSLTAIATPPGRRETKLANRRTKRSMALRKENRRTSQLLLSLLGVVLAGSLLSYAFWPSAFTPEENTLAVTPPPPASSPQTAALRLNTPQPLKGPQAEGHTPAELLSSPGLEAEDHLGSPGLAAAPDFGLGNVDALSVLGLQPATQDASETDAPGTQPSIADAVASSTGDEPLAPSLPTAEDVNVMAELDKITESAAATASESEMPESRPGALTLPPLTITTCPMQQLHKPAADLHLATRKPAWELRLEVGEGFEAAPAGPQIVAGRDMAAWLITDSEARQPATKILVQAQLVNARSASLRWKIGAVAEDMPQLFIPLGREHLDAMQQQLTQLIRRMQLAVEQLKAISRSTGIPSPVRSSTTAQRREFESQIKLGQRALEIVADANQLEGWLDGQFSVHARLLDQSRVDSTPLLQFGKQQQD